MGHPGLQSLYARLNDKTRGTREETGISPSPGLEKRPEVLFRASIPFCKKWFGGSKDKRRGVELGFPAGRGEKHRRP